MINRDPELERNEIIWFYEIKSIKSFYDFIYCRSATGVEGLYIYLTSKPLWNKYVIYKYLFQ